MTEAERLHLTFSALPESEKEITFLHSCLANPRQLHVFVTSSLYQAPDLGEADGTPAWTSALLHEEVQVYLKALHAKYSGSSALRRALHSGNCLYYLQCLTDEGSRTDFIRSVADPSFVATSW